MNVLVSVAPEFEDRATMAPTGGKLTHLVGVSTSNTDIYHLQSIPRGRRSYTYNDEQLLVSSTCADAVY